MTHRAPYPPEFRAEAVRLIRSSGKSLAEVGRELEVTTETLRIWMKQVDIDDGVRHDGLTTEIFEPASTEHPPTSQSPPAALIRDCSQRRFVGAWTERIEWTRMTATVPTRTHEP